MDSNAAISATLPTTIAIRWLTNVSERLEAALAAQKENLILWVPVVMACGIGTYFGLRFEPPAGLTMGAAAVVMILWVLTWQLRKRAFPLWILCTAIFLFTAGFALSQARAIKIASPMLQKEIKITKVTGTIDVLEEMEEGEGQRYILSDLIIDKLPPAETPNKIRLRVHTGKNLEMSPGDRVEVLAGLSPPSAPVAPGAFDFQRYAFFRQIGAFGYTYETPRIIENRPPQAFTVRLEQFRGDMITRVNAYLTKPSQSSISAAMMTGERSAVSQADNNALQASGLAHMLSISGMHIGMIATTIFFFSRLLMALIPPLVLPFPLKKFAAAAALLGAVAYVLVIGFDNIPAVRSLLMTGLVLVAVMLDRMPFSLRTVGLAAFIVLLIWPDALWTASFQMSFAAVTGLIWFFDASKNFWTRLYSGGGLLRKLALYVIGLCVTSLVATIFTAPFVLYHFQRASVYGIIANLLGVPVLGFIVMPAVVLAYFMMPLGWEQPSLWVMGQGIDIIMMIAHNVAAIPGANIYLPAMPQSVFSWLTAAALISMIWRGRGKWLALLPLAISIIIAVNTVQPDILISSDAKLMAYTPPESAEGMSVSSRVRDRFSAKVWTQRYGLPPDFKPAVWPKEGTGPGGIVCGEGGCRLETDGRRIAFSFDPSTQGEDCTWADILIAGAPVQIRCKTPVVIDFFDLWRDGAHALWLEDGRIETVAAERGKRPWSASPRR